MFKVSAHAAVETAAKSLERWKNVAEAGETIRRRAPRERWWSLQVGPGCSGRPPVDCHARLSVAVSVCCLVNTMALHHRQNAALFAAAAALRLLLFQAFPSLPNRLAGRVELSTPVSSFKRCMFPKPFTFTTQASTDNCQFKKASTSTTTMCPPTMAACTTRHRSSSRSSPSSPAPHTIHWQPTCSSQWSTC